MEILSFMETHTITPNETDSSDRKYLWGIDDEGWTSKGQHIGLFLFSIFVISLEIQKKKK